MFKKGEIFELDFIITEDVYRGFLEIFKDKNPLHIDTSFAKEKGFSDIVMHGNILSGFLSYFVGECLPIKNIMLYSQSIKYHRPVYLHDRLRFIARVSDFFESVRVAEFKFTFRKADNSKAASGNLQIGVLE